MIVEITDFAAFQEFMQTEPAAEAMKHDGVHPDTLLILANTLEMTAETLPLPYPDGPKALPPELENRRLERPLDRRVKGKPSPGRAFPI